MSDSVEPARATPTGTSNLPRAALIIPVYNTGAVLRETLDSAQAQTYPNLVIVVVDDGSTDPLTCQLLDELTDSVTSHRADGTDLVLLRQPNRGLSAARNTGFAAAQGQGAEFVMPLDSDDLIGERYVARAVEVMLTDPEIAVVYARAELFGAASGEWQLPEFDWSTFLVHNLIYCSALFRAADWIEAGGFDERMRVGREDHDFLLKVLGRGGRVHQLKTVEFFYRIRPDSMNATLAQSRSDLIDVHSRIFRNNLSTYEAHAEDLFRFIFDQHDQIRDLQHRYAALERMRTSHPRLVAWAKSLRGAARRVLRR